MPTTKTGISTWFQFPIRNSVRSDTEDKVLEQFMLMFQFPIRNSVRSDSQCIRCSAAHDAMFQFPIRNSVRSDRATAALSHRRDRVSIPHSEFCSFGHRVYRRPGLHFAMFQFPIRNSVRYSVRSDEACVNGGLGLQPVSIPHSEFCSFGQGIISDAARLCRVFQFPIRNSVRSDQKEQDGNADSHISFNSPFGILFVRTQQCLQRQAARRNRFQFPIRNSVRSDADSKAAQYYALAVSIPHSEFCSFGLARLREQIAHDALVSIPHSEFCSFGRRGDRRQRPSSRRFNSPFGILFVRTWDVMSAIDMQLSRFNSPFGILFVRTRTTTKKNKTISASFNSPFGILFVRTPCGVMVIMASCICFNSPFGILFVRTYLGGEFLEDGEIVSIPHSEFCSFGRRKDVAYVIQMTVSIPHSEFCSFGPSLQDCSLWLAFGCFNSPFGILFVRTA